MNYLIVFLATVAVDFAWTNYIAAAAEKVAHRAAAWSSLIILFGAVNIVAYSQDHWTILPAALGAYVGTWFAIRNKR